MARGPRARRKRRSAPPPAESGNGSAMQRGYARGRAKDEAVRASLEPLRPGERPPAVTVGAVAAGLLVVGNIIAMVVGFDTAPGSGADGDEGPAVAGTLLVSAVLAALAFGMWRARYGAVLGMQTLLAITIVFCSVGLVTATSIWAAVLLVLMIAAAGTLFWFLVKAMARLQMPERPGARSG